MWCAWDEDPVSTGETAVSAWDTVRRTRVDPCRTAMRGHHTTQKRSPFCQTPGGETKPTTSRRSSRRLVRHIWSSATSGAEHRCGMRGTFRHSTASSASRPRFCRILRHSTESRTLRPSPGPDEARTPVGRGLPPARDDSAYGAAMETQTEDVTVGDRLAVVSRPAGAGRWPGVVMLHEVFGINDVLRRQAERLASAGYLVVAPDLLGEGPRFGCMKRAFQALTARQGRPFEVISQTREWVSRQRECSGKVGVIGFCMGGGFALVVAPDGFDAASVNYGMIPDDVDEVLRGCLPDRGQLRRQGPDERRGAEAGRRVGRPGHRLRPEDLPNRRSLVPQRRAGRTGAGPTADEDRPRRPRAGVGRPRLGSDRVVLRSAPQPNGGRRTDGSSTCSATVSVRPPRPDPARPIRASRATASRVRAKLIAT